MTQVCRDKEVIPLAESSYDDFLARIYEHSPFFARGSEDSIRFYVEEARKAGGPVLEIGAATGLYTIPLARAGLTVVSVDISEEMLRYIAGRLTREPEDVRGRVTLLRADMRELSTGREFRTVILPGNSLLAATTVEGQLATLRAVRSNLERDGTLILDAFTPDLDLLSKRRDYGWCQFTVPDTGETYFCHRMVTVEPLHQLLCIRFIHELLRPDGILAERRISTVDFRYVFPAELHLMLRLIGFRVLRYLGDFKSQRTKSTYMGHQIIVAKKAAPAEGST